MMMMMMMMTMMMVIMMMTIKITYYFIYFAPVFIFCRQTKIDKKKLEKDMQ